MNAIVRRRAALVPPDRLVCRRKRARLVWSTIVTVLLLSATATMPASAFAADPDAYEPDDSWGAATPITVDGSTQQHTIHPAGEEDWVSFSVSSGSTYTIETGEGTPSESMDTMLYLYDSDGTTQIDYDDDGGTGAYSLIEYTADVDKTVYACVTGYSTSTTGAYALGVALTGDSFDGDAFEPDDSYGTATLITVDDTAQQHTIYPADDEDWVSFAVSSGWTYTIETGEGTPSDAMDTELYLYDSDGTTQIDYDDDGGAGIYSLIEYTADADKTVYARVAGFYSSSGSYALSVTAAALGRIDVPGNVDFGSVVVGASQRQTILVRNKGAAPLAIEDVRLTGDGFSIVRNAAAGVPIPAGESREIEVAFSPTVGYGGAPHAVKHLWSNVVIKYNYSGGVLISYFLYSGFQNTGGAGNLGWRVKTPYLDRTGAGAVVPGGRYTVKMVLYPGYGSGMVELLEPVSASFSFGSSTLGSGLGNVTYIRVADASLSIESNDSDSPTKVVDLYGISVPASARAPSITGFTPTSGPVGTSVTVTGTNLTGATRVTFNGLPAATFTALSATQIRATVPKGRTGGRIVVSTPGGSCTSAGSFTLTRSSCKVTMTLSGLRRGVLKFRKKFTAKGKVASANLSATKAKLTLQRKRGKKWVKVKIVSRTLTSTNAYSWKYKPSKKGTYRIRATVAMTATNKAGATKWRTFKVR